MPGTLETTNCRCIPFCSATDFAVGDIFEVEQFTFSEMLPIWRAMGLEDYVVVDYEIVGYRIIDRDTSSGTADHRG